MIRVFRRCGSDFLYLLLQSIMHVPISYSLCLLLSLSLPLNRGIYQLQPASSTQMGDIQPSGRKTAGRSTPRITVNAPRPPPPPPAGATVPPHRSTAAN